MISRNSYDNAPLPAQVEKRNLTPEEEEEERIKQEIWEAVNRTRQERHEREEKERREREEKKRQRKAKNPGSAKKPKLKPALPDDSEASEKVLAQRKKLEAERKKFANMRAAARKEKAAPEVDIVVASPEPARRSNRSTPSSSSNSERDNDVSSSRPTAKPISMDSEIQSKSDENSKRSSIDTTTDWKKAYDELKKRFDAEQQGKERVEQVLVQYENTINALMMEQEEALQNGDSSEEVISLRQKNKELKAELDTSKAELDAISGNYKLLTSRYKEVKSKADMAQTTENNLKQQLNNMKQQLDSLQNRNVSSGDGARIDEQASKLDRYRQAASQQIEVLKLRFAKAESQIASLKTELQGKTEENEKLTQISDTLIAMLESSNIE